MSVRRHRAIVGSAIGAGLLLAGVIALVSLSGKSTRSPAPPSIAPAVTSPFPAPLRGAVVFARQDRTDVLALAVAPQAHGVVLRASVVGPQGRGVRGLRVALTAGERGGTHSARAASCGAGCYQASFTLRSRPLALRARVERPSRTTIWNVRLPSTWPAQDATALVARATRVWRHLRSLSYVDRLSSDSTHTIVSRWRIVAPDRVAYEVGSGGGQAVIVGSQRWDRSPGGEWVKSSATRLDQPQPFWVSATDAHVVGSGRIRGRPVWRVSFFDPKTPGWFLVSIDKKTAWTLDVRMQATAHFMHDTYRQFNAPLRIVAPAS
jgi:hypothetical protein